MDTPTTSVPPYQVQPSAPPPDVAPARKVGMKKGVVAAVIVGVLALGYAAWAWTSGTWPFASEPAATESPSPSPTATDDPTVGWKTYTNAQYGFEVKYPAEFGISATLENDQKLVIRKLSEPVGGGSSAEAVTFWVSVPGSEPKGASVTIAGKSAHQRLVPGEVGGDFLRTVVPLGSVDLVIDRPQMPVPEQIFATLRFTDPTAGWKTYTSAQYGFEIKYPKDWTTKSGTSWGGYPGAVSLLSPELQEDQGRTPTNRRIPADSDIDFIVTSIGEINRIEKSNGIQYASLADYLDRNTLISEEQRITFNGYPAWKAIEGGKSAYYVIFLESGGRIYKILFERRVQEADVTALERQILSTFRFTQ